MRLEELDYTLPPEAIAQVPAEPRDAARLLVVHRQPAAERQRYRDARFADLWRLLRAGDVLVRNNTRVIPARTWFRRPTGGRLEVLFLHLHGSPAEGAECWEVLVRGRPRVGEMLSPDASVSGWTLRVLHGYGDGRWVVESQGPSPVLSLLERHGVMPLPPYIHRSLEDPSRYQTTYARHAGSAAAPTAGLHFTAELEAALQRRGVRIVDITLHVGLGTFQPLSGPLDEQTRLHVEEYCVSPAAWRTISSAKSAGQRIVAVGTTTVRTLEHLALHPPSPEVERPISGSTELCIVPGFHFRLVDVLITNFHLPRTSLLALVMAFCGCAETKALYSQAIARGYRFYSFGDAMIAL